MELSNYISYIPRLAGGLLVLIGLLIAFEIYLMVKPKESEKDEKNAELSPDTMKPLQFSTQAPSVQKKSMLPNIPISQKAIITSIIFLIVLTLSLLGVHYIFVLRGGTLTEQNPIEQPVQTLPNARPIIRIFKVDPQGTWNQLSENQLRKLLKGDEIRISVEYPLDVTAAQFVINGETYEADITQVSPQGNPYILYTIPEDKQNFYIEVYVD